jgi:thiol-disulfide isomerase/thioredoxin
MDEFKEVLDENHEYMVTFWVSPWCKACRSMEPAVKALAKHHPNVKFIQIPVVDDNANLHQGLEVPSVPFVHLYLKESQLAEEQNFNRKKIPAFHKMLQDYENGYCSLDRHGGADQWSTSCPYNGIPAVHVPASPVTLHD